MFLGFLGGNFVCFVCLVFWFWFFWGLFFLFDLHFFCLGWVELFFGVFFDTQEIILRVYSAGFCIWFVHPAEFVGA